MSRCITLYQAYCLCKEKNDSLIVIWPLHRDCHIHFREVFSKDAFPELKVTVKETDDFKDKYFGIHDLIRSKRYKEAFVRTIKRIIFDLKHSIEKLYIMYYRVVGRYVDYYPPNDVWEGDSYQNYSQIIRKRFAELYNKRTDLYLNAYCGISDDNQMNVPVKKVIVFAEKYEVEADRILAPYRNYKITGVHIRRTDHKAAIEHSKSEYFDERIDEIIKADNERYVFLATDDSNEEKRLRNLFGEKIISLPSKVWNRTSSEGIESGIIDCICLSKCEYILGSFASVFSGFAAKYGEKALYICDGEKREGPVLNK